jgi:hypothetical protein
MNPALCLTASVFAVCLAATGAAAQTATGRTDGATCPAAAANESPVRLIARVRAAELVFDSRPQTAILHLGCPPADTVRILRRQNVPDPVQPGVTYRDIDIVFELRTDLTVLCTPLLQALLDNARSEAGPSPGLAALRSACSSDREIRRQQ